MQRKLILMRHAQSAHRSLQGSDHDRTLTERGARDAPRVAERLMRLGWAPQRVLSVSYTHLTLPTILRV